MGDISWSSPNSPHSSRHKTKDELSLLTRSQVIEDVRYFITYHKTHSLGMNNSQVILIGSHLGGSLAAWTQQKYPLLVNGGVWATGAPFTSQQHLPGYLQSIERFVEDGGGQKCLHALDDTFRIIQEEMTGVTPAEYTEVYEMCPGFDFKKHQDQSTFLYRLFSTISQSLLLNRPKDVSDLCYELLDPQYLDVVEAFAPYFLSHQRGKGRCIDYSFRHLINDTANRDGVIDLWAYQSCSEFGWFPGGPENHWLPATFFDSICYNAFSLLGEQREEAQEETQKLFEGIVANAKNNIVLSYGEVDPWSRAGIQEFPGKSKERQVIIVPGEPSSNFSKNPFENLVFFPGVSFRNTLMHSLARNDSQDVQKAKMLIINKLEKWAEMSKVTDTDATDSGAGDRLTVIPGSGLFLLLPLTLLFASGIGIY